MRIDLGISLIGGNNKKETSYVRITRKDIVKRIKTHSSLDEWTKDYIIKRLNDYPDNALGFFVKNINQVFITALKERSRVLKEQNDKQKEDSASFSSETECTEFIGNRTEENREEITNKEAPKEESRDSLFSNPGD